MPAPTITIDCDHCTMQATSACDDCLVTFLLGREPDDAVVIDADEARVLRLLERAGLAPGLRFEDRAPAGRSTPVAVPVRRLDHRAG